MSRLSPQWGNTWRQSRGQHMKREYGGRVFRDLVLAQAGGVCCVCPHLPREGNESVKKAAELVESLRKTS